MDKKLLAAAVAAAMFAPAVASADVTVYGRAQVEYAVEDYDNGADGSVQSVDDAAGQSRIGFKFKEKLGGGLTAFGKMEFKVDLADYNTGGTDGDGADKGNSATAATPTPAIGGSLGQRDAFVGIKGSWGSVTAGSHHAPYKVNGGVKWDKLNATHLQARRAGGMTGGTGIGGHNGFVRNSIQYTSPNVNGFKVAVLLAPDETNVGGTENISDGDNDYSIAGSYKNGPWHAIVAHNRNNNPSGTDDETLTKIGLQWKSGPWSVAGQYEWVDDADRVDSGGSPGFGSGGGAYRIGGTDDGEVLFLQGSYKAGNNIFVATYGNTDADADLGAEDYDFDMYTIGVIHKFSKKTRIFGGFTSTDGDDDSPNGSARQDRDAWSIGIRKDF